MVVWPRGLTDVEMRGVSEHLINRIRPPLRSLPAAYPGGMKAWYCPSTFDLASSTYESSWYMRRIADRLVWPSVPEWVAHMNSILQSHRSTW